MQVFINDEEVVCAKNLTVSKQLATANSVILNNVYPKTWEQDKDYVSRFYMPNDYSRCEIKDENLKIVKELSYKNYYVTNRYTDDSTLTIKSNTGSRCRFCAVTPGEKYRITTTSSVNEYVYEADSIDIDESLTRLGEIEEGTHTIDIIPTKPIIIFTIIDENLNTVITSLNTKIITSKKIVNSVNNVGILKERILNFSDSTLYYNPTYNTYYIKVIPNKTYIIEITNPSGYRYICETNSLNLNTECTRLQIVSYTGTAYYSIKPTCEYLVWASNMELLSITTEFESDVLFSGIIKNSGNINLNPRYPHYSTLQAIDYTSLLSEGDMLNYVLDKQTPLNMLKRIVEDLEGFMLGEFKLESNEEIGPYNCNEKTPNDVFNYIAEITGSIWYAETISKDLTLIHFYSVDNLPKAETIEYNNDYFENKNIVDIQYSYSTNNYRNKQTITNNNVISNTLQTENIAYWNNVIETNYPIGSIVSIKNGSRNYSFATDTAKATGISANFYYTKGSNKLDVNTTSIKTGSVLTIKYYPLITSRQIAFNQEEIDRITEQTNRNGIISRYEKRTDISNELALSKIAQTYLDFKGVPEVTVTVKSYQSNLFNLGDVVFFNAPLESLKTNYLIRDIKVNMTVIDSQQEIFYSYELSSSFNDENAINFFDNQRRKQIGDIEEGEYISRYIDIPSSTNIIFYGVNFEQVETSENMLDGELDIDI